VGTEIFRSSAVMTDTEAIHDMPQNRRFRVAENFELERMSHKKQHFLFLCKNNIV
jgi:hypothetical protein